MLLKIQALADRGMAGEAENARRLLEKLCARHGVSLESLGSVEKRLYRFAFSDPLERLILGQCAHFICRQRPESDPLMAVKKPKTVHFELTEAEHIDLVDCWKHYRKLWREHIEEVQQAFIAKHRLFGRSPKDEDSEPMDPIKLQRIIDMIRSMDGQSWNRPAARLTA